MAPESRSPSLGLFAVLECATGLGLLLVPGTVIGLLFGRVEPGAEALLIARLGGVVLLAFAAASWRARTFRRSRASLGLLAAVTLYNCLAAAALAFAALGLNLRGVLIWPGLLCHVVLLPWCLGSGLRMRRKNPR